MSCQTPTPHPTGATAVWATDRAAMVTLLSAAKQAPADAATAATITPLEASAAEPPVLTPRERDIGRLVVAGHTYKEIGEQLHISGKTVEHHMARIRAKLAASAGGVSPAVSPVASDVTLVVP